MATRSATVQWTGGLQDGSGQVSLDSSHVGTFDVSFPRRIADEAGGVTSPEELIAAAHASCFAMALSGGIEKAGGTPGATSITADVTVGPDEEQGGLKISRIALDVTVSAEGISADDFDRVAEETKTGCPVSKALAAVPEVVLSARLSD
ncbi:osmotically inducible protein OsmC [Mumia flava]|uniref:Osmotically inducible protein OsmC n=1 Tax=Mumia flava TaxID=1348852 RepID=A0A0B2BW23_9ACTN|nr:OsmC family peroxiredoxin [Mumia flava]PJJ54194.1 osmotically inducible protein OsmC [Mumia flava]